MTKCVGSHVAVLVLMILAGVTACSEPPTGEPATPTVRSGPTTARWELAEQMREDLHNPRHAADGGGRAWLEAEPGETPRASVGTAGRWTIVYEAGPLGIAVGGMIYFQVSPFWGWSTPQPSIPASPGFTQVTTEAPGVLLKPRTLDEQLLGIAIFGEPLKAGQQVRIVYGAGSAGALADRFAERGSSFWIAVDGDGDGVRKLLAESPTVDVQPGPAEQVVVTLPTTAHPGTTVRLTVAVLDARGDAGAIMEGSIGLVSDPPGLDLPATITLTTADVGRKTIDINVPREGLYRVRAVIAKGPDGISNPMLVANGVRRVLWADLHGHSNYSDGTGLPEDFFSYARDVAALDVVALTDHEHWGMRFLDQYPEMWDHIRAQNTRFHEPNRFVTLLGFEWTSWIYGHRHVLFFDDDAPLLSSLDPASESPTQLWAALRGRKALTVAHHSAGGPIAVDWSIAPDPAFEPVTEVVSVHGSSEAADTPGRIYDAVDGNYVQDALKRGYRLGFVGSGDGHDGHPGLTHLAGPSGGLAAIFSEDLTRTAVYDALRARRTYATNGPRIFLSVLLDEQLMGAVVPTAKDPNASRKLTIRVVAPAPIDHVDIIRSGRVAEYIMVKDTIAHIEREVPTLGAGEYLYVRVVQFDGGAAWSSPFFAE